MQESFDNTVQIQQTDEILKESVNQANENCNKAKRRREWDKVFRYFRYCFLFFSIQPQPGKVFEIESIAYR